MLRALRLIPELNIAALRQGKDRELLFWYLLRLINQRGCGHIRLDEAERIFTSQFSYSPRTFDRHLKLGKGKLWEFYNKRGCEIKIRGVSKACEYLETYKLSRFVSIEVFELLKYPRKAILWNIGSYRPFGTGRINHPISRQSLKDVTRIEIRNQQRYDNQVETPRVKTIVKDRDPETYKLHCQRIPVIAKNGKQVLIKRQLGNKYYSHGTQSRKGLLRKAARKAKERQGSFLSAEAPNKSLMPSKRFHSRFKDWLKDYQAGKNNGEDSYYPLISNSQVYVQCAIF